MNTVKSKSMERIEATMETLEEGSLRYKLLQCAKSFKTSWVEFGQALYAVWKDKAYKDWGYQTFEAYTAREIGIKQPTAMKLLKSYYFLEQEEPRYLKENLANPSSANTIPNYESVNMLRLVKEKPVIGKDDYESLRVKVLDQGKEPAEVRKEITSIMKQRAELEPDEVRAQKRVAVLRRMVGSLRALKTEAEVSKMLPATIVKEISGLISRIELEIQ